MTAPPAEIGSEPEPAPADPVPRFLCDAMLHRLARWLRAAGYDTEVARHAEGDGSVVRKLGHKVRLGEGPAAVACTNLYLDETEWSLLVALPAGVLRKRRHLVRRDGWLVAIDELHHGYGESRPRAIPRLLLDERWGQAALYAGALVFGYLLLRGRRFGRARPAAEGLSWWSTATPGRRHGPTRYGRATSSRSVRPSTRRRTRCGRPSTRR